MSGYVLFGGIVGLVLGEWAGITRNPIRLLWVGILVILALIGGGVVFYLGKKDAAPNAASSTASPAAAAEPQANADAVKLAHGVRAALDKVNIAKS